MAFVGISVGERDDDADMWTLRVEGLLPTDAGRSFYDQPIPEALSYCLRCCGKRRSEMLKATEIADELVLDLPGSDARHQEELADDVRRRGGDARVCRRLHRHHTGSAVERGDFVGHGRVEHTNPARQLARLRRRNVNRAQIGRATIWSCH